MKLLLLLLCIGISQAQAAKLSQETIMSVPETVDLPLKGLESSHHLDENLTSSETKSGALELRVSSWQPKQLQLSSYSNSLSAFKNMGVPQLGISYEKPLNGRLSLEIGTSLLALQRSGSITSGGQQIALEQDAYLPQLRAGLQYLFVDSAKPLRPYVGAAISPTLILTKRSAVDDGISSFGFTYEAGLGTLVRLSALLDLDINASETLGNINSSKMENFAVASGIRVNL
jgi:outer membrane protein W